LLFGQPTTRDQRFDHALLEHIDAEHGAAVPLARAPLPFRAGVR
jgi:hypothetical protein